MLKTKRNIDLETMNEELIRQAVYYRDGGECQYCGEPQSIDDFTLGYIVPPEQGGTSDITNRRCMCQRCEELKDDSTDEQIARRIIYFRIHQLLELFDPDLIPVFAKIWGEALKKGCINITAE